MTDSAAAGFSERYFLRRLAQAWRSRSNSTPGASYFDALSESALLFFGLPSVSIGAIVIFYGLRHASVISYYYGLSPKAETITGILFSLGCGHLWAHLRFRKYARDSSARLAYDSEKDRQIIFCQKLGATVLFFFVIPSLALYLFVLR